MMMKLYTGLMHFMGYGDLGAFKFTRHGQKPRRQEAEAISLPRGGIPPMGRKIGPLLDSQCKFP